MSVYEQYRDSRTSWGIGALGSVIVEVELEDGTIGVGISIGGEAACFCVENHLSRFVEGQDPTNVELIYDQMWRSTMNYGRKGLAIQAISAVDLVSSSMVGSFGECARTHFFPLPRLYGTRLANSKVCPYTSSSVEKQSTACHAMPQPRVPTSQKKWDSGV